MGRCDVLGTLAIRVPLPEAGTKVAISRLLEPDEDAWRASALHESLNGRRDETFILAHRDIDKSIIIVHSQGETEEEVRVTNLDIRIEPGSFMPARRATESAYRRLIHASALANGRYAPRFGGATVTVRPGQDILVGRPTTLKDVLRSPEFRLPTATGLAAALLLVTGWWLLPTAEKPSAWWTVAPLAMQAVVAFVLALTLRFKDDITWSVV